MSKLIKNELIKIFKKKTIYITMAMVLLLLIFMNCMFKFANNNFYSGSYYAYSENYIQIIKEELGRLDPNKPSDVTTYVNYKTDLDIYELMNKYTENKDSEWKLSIISERIAPYVNERNTYLYGTEKDETKVKEINKEIDSLVKKLDENDWKYFANQDLEKANAQIEALTGEKQKTEDTKIISNIDGEIKNAQVDKEIAEYRINKNIPYGTDYLNNAIQKYKTSCSEVISFENLDRDLEYAEQKEYNESIKNREESKYILDNNVDINKMDSLKGILENFYSQFGLFLIVVIVMIAGTIVSEEFNKGTIKLLLVKPYSRKKILLSKLVTVLIMIAFVIVTTVIMQIIVGGILFGFDSLSTPVVEYNFNTGTLEEMNVFAYLGIQTLTQLPMIILLSTLAFALSTIFSNSALAITISLLGYMSTSIINQLSIAYNLGFMKYFVTMNWDLSQYLFGNLPPMQGMNMLMSVIICIVYFAIMIVPTFIIFKRRNIKNI